MLTYLVRVAHRLDEILLREAAEILVVHNEMLRCDVDERGPVAGIVPASIGERLVHVRDGACGDEAWILEDLRTRIWPAMRPRAGDSLRIVVRNDAGSASLLLTVDPAIADGRTLVLLVEDICRLYQQLAGIEVVTQRPAELSYPDARAALSPTQRAQLAASVAASGDASPRERETTSFALRADLLGRLSAARLDAMGISVLEVVYGGLARTLARTDAGVIACRADLRLTHRLMAQTSGPLHIICAPVVHPRTDPVASDVRRLAGQLRDAIARADAAPRDGVLLDLECLTPPPVGDDEWRPQGFVVDASPVGPWALEVRPFFKDGRVWVSVTCEVGEAQTVATWREAEAHGQTTVWEPFFAELDDRAIAPAPVPARPRIGGRVRQQRQADADLVELGPLNGRADLMPVVIRPRTADLDTFAWAAANRQRVNDLLDRHGAILFRGFDVRAPADFHRFAASVTGELLDYSERAAPRHEVAQHVYTSTEYPPEYPIPMHHENAFAYKWPMKVFFYCNIPAVEGGETPIADDRAFFARLDPDVREAFRRKQVKYVRNYGAGVDLTWQEAFQSTDRATVERYCDAAGLTCEWRGDDRLRTTRVAPAIVPHPKSGQDLWFNHAHLFHISNLEDSLRESFRREFEEGDLPRNAYFGDGTPIDDAVLDHVRDTYSAVAVRFPWTKGDVLFLDNMAVAHGREAFVGERSTLVIMAESSAGQSSIAPSLAV